MAPSREWATDVNATDADSVTLRPAERADLLDVYRIEQASFPQPWPFTAFDSFLGADGFFVAVTGTDTVVGYVVADVVHASGRRLGHIKDLAVHPDMRGRGIGTRLLARAIQALEATGVTVTRLEVRSSNDAAQSLYRRFDFEFYRRVEAYYLDGEDAYVYVRRTH